MRVAKMEKETKELVVFKGNKIRRVLHNDEWYFSIIDIIQVLSESTNARRYWSDLKIKLTKEEGFEQLYEKIVQLKLESTDGKKYETDAANSETIFRII
jgi:prophage antirepressor-like protein